MNIKTARYQTLFNSMWIGLNRQGWEQSLDGDCCSYRGEGGLKCAIGHCIDNKTATDWGTLAIYEIADSLGLSNKRKQFLLDCQVAHDINKGLNMKNRFQDIAAEYNLTIPGA